MRPCCAARSDAGQRVIGRARATSRDRDAGDGGDRARSRTTLGPVDVLVNSAGFCTPRRFRELADDEIRAPASDVNLLGVDHTRAARRSPHMIARGRGHIVNVARWAGYLGVYGYTAYARRSSP